MSWRNSPIRLLLSALAPSPIRPARACIPSSEELPVHDRLVRRPQHVLRPPVLKVLRMLHPRNRLVKRIEAVPSDSGDCEQRQETSAARTKAPEDRADGGGYEDA